MRIALVGAPYGPDGVKRIFLQLVENVDSGEKPARLCAMRWRVRRIALTWFVAVGGVLLREDGFASQRTRQVRGRPLPRMA